MVWRVMVTTKTKAHLVLKSGFKSADAAEDYRTSRACVLHWPVEETWVQEYVAADRYVPRRRRDTGDATAPFPWRLVKCGTNHNDYIVDAKGRKVLMMLGPEKRRRAVYDIIVRGLAAARQDEAA